MEAPLKTHSKIGDRVRLLLTAFAVVIGIVLMTGLVKSCLEEEKVSTNRAKISSKAYRLENVRVEKTYPNAWGVCGSIRNLKDHSVKGYVDIEFLDSSGKSYFTTHAYVKHPNHSAMMFYAQPDWIEPRQVGAFEYWTDPRAFTGLSDFRITFRESKLP